VGGHNVKMDDLCKPFHNLGFTNVQTFIASGNVIFETRSRNAKALEKKIEEQLRVALGYDVATFLRTDNELSEISKYKPFTGEVLATAVSTNVGFVQNPLSKEVETGLMAFKTEIDHFHVNGREVYWLSRMKQGDSKFSNAVFERILKGKATFRGLNTIHRLAAKYLNPGSALPG
jgi:uncharacterized protein (DUF1697 family)